MDIIVKIFTLENEGREINGVITLPTGKGDYPLVVMNHGFGGSKEEGIGFITISKDLAKHGIASVRFDFSGCGASVVPFSQFTLKNNISDSSAVLKYVLETESIDQDKLGILGYSMGGRLAVLVTNEDNNPYKAMALIAPGAQTDLDMSMVPGFELEGEQAVIDFYGQRYEISNEFLKEGPVTNEIMKHITKKVDSIVFSGTNDILVTPKTCQIVTEKLHSTLFTLEGADHGYGFFEDVNMDYVNKIVDETTAFFCKTL